MILMSELHRFIVVARVDGRGGYRPFGAYRKGQAGARVSIGNKSYRVGRDGRVNIPKSVMDKGLTGFDGRKRVTIEFASSPGKEGWRDVGAVIGTPDDTHTTSRTGDLVGRYEELTDELEPSDSSDYNWSP